MSASEAALVARINSTVARINEKSGRLAGNVSRGIGWLPPGVQHAAREGWDRFCALMKQIWDKLAEIFSNLGSPWSLKATAAEWSSQVSGPVSALAGNADKANTEVDRYWEGDAATAYLDTLPAQTSAIQQIRATFSEPISTALDGMRNAIWIFWGALVVALAALVGGIIGAVTASGTIIGIPVGVAIAVGAAVVFLGSLIAGYWQLRSSAATQNNLLLQKLNDNTGFRSDGGQVSWPRSTIEG